MQDIADLDVMVLYGSLHQGEISQYELWREGEVEDRSKECHSSQSSFIQCQSTG